MVACALCGGKIGMFDNKTIADMQVCSDCFEQYNVIRNATPTKYADYFGRKEIDKAEQRMRAYARVGNAAGGELSAVLDFLDEAKSGAGNALEEQKRMQELEAEYRREYKNVLLTTTNSVEGYDVVEYLGLVFGETIYKASFGDAMEAAVDNMVKSMSFSAKELSSSVRLQEEARQFAIKKLQLNAIRMGANAVIGIDTDNTVGSSLAYLSIHGTAVRIERESDLGLKN